MKQQKLEDFLREQDRNDTKVSLFVYAIVTTLLVTVAMQFGVSFMMVMLARDNGLEIGAVAVTLSNYNGWVFMLQWLVLMVFTITFGNFMVMHDRRIESR